MYGVAMDVIFYTTFSSPIGSVSIASTEKGICRLELFREEKEFVRELSSGFKGRIVRDDGRFRTIREKLTSYFQGKPTGLEVSLDLKGTNFQKQVWTETAKIEYGGTKAYQEIASAINKPKASRAVGNALGRNPVAIVVPCHRVIRSDGTLGGFGYGLPLKKKLLELEKAAIRPAGATTLCGRCEGDYRSTSSPS